MEEYVDVDDNNTSFEVVEAKGYFRFKTPIINDMPSYFQSVLEWNNKTVKIVAIDGQHRLTALKLYNESNQDADFKNWTIPAVLFSVKKDSQSNATLLDIIRNIFVYINTEAKTPSPARQILLSDESINCICTQEILEYSHENDVSDIVDSSKIPLLVYDWRGEQKDSVDIVSPAAIKNIEEIHDWLSFYILGKDFSSDQQEALDVDISEDGELGGIFSLLNPSVPQRLVQSIRDKFNNDVRVGFVYLLENFTPYKNYISFIRDLENEYSSQSHRYAFDNLKFGTSGASRTINASVAEAQEEILEAIQGYKVNRSNFPELLSLEIGMRSVVFAYSRLRVFYSEIKNEAVKWSDYSVWFTRALNQAYEDGWLKDRLNPHIKHISYDHNENTINYRLDKVDGALGAFMTILIARYATSNDDALNDKWNKLYSAYQSDISDRLTSGYRRERRYSLKDSFPEGGRPLTNAVNEAADQDVNEHFRNLNMYLNGI